jgi:uncharacterized protein (TIGR02300 family)
MRYADAKHAIRLLSRTKETDVTKPELGTKRVCGGCGLRFYDLHKSRIVCPTCDTVFEPPKAVSAKPRRPWEGPTAPVLTPVGAQAPAAIIADDAPEDSADTANEKNEEDVSVDEDFEKE